MIDILFIACSLLTQPGIKAPCKEVSLTVMTGAQAYGVVGPPIFNAGSGNQWVGPTPYGATVYQEAEQLNAKNCQRNGQYEISKWAIAHPNFTLKAGFKCGAAGVFAKI